MERREWLRELSCVGGASPGQQVALCAEEGEEVAGAGGLELAHALALGRVGGGAAGAQDVGLLERAGALLEHRAVGLAEGGAHQGAQGEQQQQHLRLAPWRGATGFIGEIRGCTSGSLIGCSWKNRA